MGAGVPASLQNWFEGLVASWVGSIPTYSRHFFVYNCISENILGGFDESISY